MVINNFIFKEYYELFLEIILIYSIKVGIGIIQY
jgi:hypothetical protein